MRDRGVYFPMVERSDATRPARFITAIEPPPRRVLRSSEGRLGDHVQVRLRQTPGRWIAIMIGAILALVIVGVATIV